MKHSLIVAFFLLLCGPLFALEASEMFEDPAKEARARDIGRQLRCLVCQNESIFDSNAQLARDLRVLVRERMEEGESDTEVIAYIADRYGDYVLLKPRLNAMTYALWLAPIGMLLFGAGALIAYHRRRTVLVVSEPLSEDERAAARRLLDKE